MYDNTALDDQAELLSEDERKELVLWRAMNELRYAMDYCGKDHVFAQLKLEF